MPTIDLGKVVPSINGIEPVNGNVDITHTDVDAVAQPETENDTFTDGSLSPWVNYKEDLSSLKDTKADCITDTSARAASHELYAQRGPMGVTLFGATTETGTGDKSPDNPYTISGVDAARVHVGGKNLLDAEKQYTYTVGDPSYIEILNADEVMLLAKLLDGQKCTISFDVVTSGVAWAESGNRRVGIETRVTNSETGVEDYDIGLWATSSELPSTGNYNAIKSSTVYLVKGFDKSYNMYIHFQGLTAGTVTVKNLQIELGLTATAYEPYNANVITPPLLPDGAPLMGNGTVDDTVENDVLSGCDKKIVLDGSEDETYTQSAVSPTVSGYRYKVSGIADAVPAVGNATAGYIYSDRLRNGTAEDSWFARPSINIDANGIVYVFIDGITTVDDLRAYLSANPLTVYYRSTDYTPEKDLRVARVVRRWNTYVLTGDEKYQATATIGEYGYYFYCYSNPVSVTSADAVVCNMLTPNMELKESNSNSASYINTVSAGASSANPRFIVSHELLGTTAGSTTSECLAAAKAWVKALYDAGTPLTVSVQLATPEIYMTDPLPLRKPDTLTTDTVTVTGSEETAVSYPHMTKHYIDSKISELVTLALANQ